MSSWTKISNIKRHLFQWMRTNECLTLSDKCTSTMIWWLLQQLSNDYYLSFRETGDVQYKKSIFELISLPMFVQFKMIGIWCVKKHRTRFVIIIWKNNLFLNLLNRTEKTNQCSYIRPQLRNAANHQKHVNC